MTIRILPIIFCLLCSLAGFCRPAKQLSFIENKGQITDQSGIRRSDIDFKLTAAPGLNIFIAKGAIHYQWSKAEQVPLTWSEDGNRSGANINMYRMDVALLGANTNARVSTENHLTYSERYYLPSADGAVARSYQKLTYHDIYPGIDWVFYINGEGKLEHDFIVHPGGKVSDIRLQYSGSTHLTLAADGSLLAITPLGTIKEAAPYVYEQSSKRKIAGKYILNWNELTFTVAPYQGSLVIDPTVDWGTYFGGTDYEDISKMVFGKYGEIYVTGSTGSAANIATTGAFQQSFGGGSGLAGADAFLSRFSEDGSCLWSTYYGGPGVDLGKAVACDTTGNIYLSGRTNSSTSIATTGSYQPTKAGSAASYDGLLVKFDTSGQRLWGTYFGGPGQEGTHQVTVTCDRQNGIYLSGNTASSSGIATAGAYQAVFGGSQDAFLARFDVSGNLNWATYFGGSGLDVGYSLSTDSSGNVFLAGYSGSSGLATIGAHQAANGGGEDILLAKFNDIGQLQWATYLGGTEQDRALSISLDSQEDIYIGGLSLSPTGIATVGSHQATLGDPAGDGVLAKFSANGALLWSTYYGGSQSDVIHSISNIGQGVIYIAGTTNSNDAIATPDGLDTALTGAYNAFVGKFDTAGNRVWGSYYGNLFDEATSALVTSAGKVIIGGKTYSSTGIGTPGAYQPLSGGDQDGFIVAINDCEVPGNIDTVFGDLVVCAGDTVTYIASTVLGADTYQWLLPSGWSGADSSDSIQVAIGNTSGTIQVAAINQCGSSDTAAMDITVKPQPVPVINRNGYILSTTQSFPSYQWNLNGAPIAGATGPTHIADANGDYTVTVTNAGGCKGSSAPVTITDITAIDDLGSGYGIKLFPNPANDQVNIELPFAATLQLTDINGRTMNITEAKKGRVTLALHNLCSGIYALKIYDGSNSYLGTIKLIKQ